MIADRFPRASSYHPDWLIAGVSGAANPLWLAEWLSEVVELRPGMRVLDLGCGRALSSIFLRREFGVQVWATDLWFSASENWQRICDAGVGDGVWPLRADARSLPFARDFFDAIVSVDSFVYYGTDDLYLSYLARLVKPGGAIGIAGAGLVQEMTPGVPDYLKAWWTPDLACLHSAEWWRAHWIRSGVVDVLSSDTLPDGWKLWRQWVSTIAPANMVELQALDDDAGRTLGYVRAVCRRRADAELPDPVVEVSSTYVRKPVRRIEGAEV